MTKLNKILLTIPSILVFTYMVTFWFPTEFQWLIPDMKSYYIQIFTIQGLTIIQIIFLIFRLRSFKNIEKSIKTDWVWLLILFSSITSLIYIWNKDAEFEQMNKNAVHNTV